MRNVFKSIIGKDGFARLPIRIQGSGKRTIKLIGIVDTALANEIQPAHKTKKKLLKITVFRQQTQSP